MAINKLADTIGTVEQYAVRAFADALEEIPMALAENSGLNPINSLTSAKAKQNSEKQSIFGIDCLSKGTNNMK